MIGTSTSDSKPRPRLERAYNRLTLWRAMGIITAVTTVIVVAAAIAERLLEPETFPTIGDALWFAMVTISTTGYGDLVPQTAEGRLVASFVMFVSLALVPVVTSVVVTALMTRNRERRMEAASPSDPSLSRQSDDREGQG